MKLTAFALAAAILTGCNTGKLDQIMGRVDGTPITQPAPEQKIHCDLIFPGADRR